jgi:hypothetical protein
LPQHRRSALFKLAKALAVTGAICAGAARAGAADLGEAIESGPYLFRVNCPTETYLAQWTPDAMDPGKNYFRIATGDVNLDCSIYDYDPRYDAALPRRACRYPGGAIRAFPALLIPLGATHCR